MNTSPNHTRTCQRSVANRITRGKCARCNRRQTPGLTRCPPHREADRVGRRTRDTLLRALGLCIKCKKEVEGGYPRCSSCQTAETAYQREWKRAKRLRDASAIKALD